MIDVATTRRGGLQGLADAAFLRTTQGFAFLLLVTLLAIIVSLVVGAWPALRTFGLGFVTSTAWNPVTEEFGA
ncbi:MAG TPA: phosphate ABC transporter permease subunit PstC, partial [Thermodesulfobacteriota bacterium]